MGLDAAGSWQHYCMGLMASWPHGLICSCTLDRFCRRKMQLQIYFLVKSYYIASCLFAIPIRTSNSTTM